MDRKSIALYQDLLDDLSKLLPSSLLSDFSAGREVRWFPGMTPKQYAAFSIGKSLFKKFEGFASPDADAAALRKFLASNERCRTWESSHLSSWDEEMLGTVKKHLYNFFYPAGEPLITSFSQIYERGRCGPGSSVGSLGCDSYTKMYSSQLTHTNDGIYRAYRDYVSSYPLEADAESFRQAYLGSPTIVEGNRLSFVPKQSDISRTICVEPTLNMYGQLGIGGILEDRLKQYFGIDLSIQQDFNRELARAGSLSGQLFTMDLESASDTISLKMLEYLLPRDVLAWFKLFRSPECRLPDGTSVPLYMISSMGNGFTFPLQTIIFSAVVSAAYDLLDLRRFKSSLSPRSLENSAGVCNCLGNWGVFGDDIIASKETYSLISRTLGYLGFKVNAEKSFHEGTFRESCGGDFYKGSSVRGIYIRSLDTVQDRVAVINRLFEWSAITGITLHKVMNSLLHTVPKRFVPIWENEDAGIRVPWEFVERMRRDKDTGSIIYRKWVPNIKAFKLLTPEDAARRGRLYNPSGLHISFLRGHIRSSKISVRQTVGSYRTKCGVAPSWDTPRKVLVTDTSWRRWNTVVWLALKG